MSRLLINFFEHFMMEGAVEFTTAAGQRHIVDKPLGFLPAIHFTDRAAELRLLSNPALALGELFTEGRLIVTRGSIYDVLVLATRNLALQPPTRLLRMRERLNRALRRMQPRNSELNAKRNVAHHYDLDCRLYDLFLDPDRQYSCAYFEHPGQGLGEAHLAKKRHLAAKLLVEPGHRVLDIGSGWGGLALTLSEEQLSVARGRQQKQGLGGAVDFRLQDYRAVTDTFDRIANPTAAHLYVFLMLIEREGRKT